MDDLGLYSYNAVEKMRDGCEVIDMIEGCLIDNILYYDDRDGKYYMCLEHALNCWQSCYRVYSEGDRGIEILNTWDSFLAESKICA